MPFPLLEWLSPFLLVEMPPFFNSLLTHSSNTFIDSLHVLIVLGAGQTEVK